MYYSSKVAFVSFSTGGYIEIEKGFQRSVMKTQPNILLFSLHDFSDIGSPDHKDDPYAFKMHAIEYVHKLGYDIVVWCDSPSRLVKRIDVAKLLTVASQHLSSLLNTNTAARMVYNNPGPSF